MHEICRKVNFLILHDEGSLFLLANNVKVIKTFTTSFNFRSRVEHLERCLKTDLNRQRFLKSRLFCLSRGKISAEIRISAFDLFFTILQKVFLSRGQKTFVSSLKTWFSITINLRRWRSYVNQIKFVDASWENFINKFTWIMHISTSDCDFGRPNAPNSRNQIRDFYCRVALIISAWLTCYCCLIGLIEIWIYWKLVFWLRHDTRIGAKMDFGRNISRWSRCYLVGCFIFWKEAEAFCFIKNFCLSEFLGSFNNFYSKCTKFWKKIPCSIFHFVPILFLFVQKPFHVSQKESPTLTDTLSLKTSNILCNLATVSALEFLRWQRNLRRIHARFKIQPGLCNGI